MSTHHSNARSSVSGLGSSSSLPPATTHWQAAGRVALLVAVAVLLSLALALASAALVQASVPDIRFCQVDTSLVASPNGGFLYAVVVRNEINEGIPNADVVLDFTPSVGIALCGDADPERDRLLSAFTNGSGRAEFWIKAGGITTGYVQVSANTFPLQRTRPRTPDLDGDLDVDEADRQALDALVGTTGPTGDLDADRAVDSADQQLLEQHRGETCSQAPAERITWGSLKVAYR